MMELVPLLFLIVQGVLFVALIFCACMWWHYSNQYVKSMEKLADDCKKFSDQMRAIAKRMKQ
jgi:hypothetical protein